MCFRVYSRYVHESLQVIASTVPCDAHPVFVAPTPAQGTCVYFPAGRPHSFPVVARSSASSVSWVVLCSKFKTIQETVENFVTIRCYAVPLLKTKALNGIVLDFKIYCNFLFLLESEKDLRRLWISKICLLELFIRLQNTWNISYSIWYAFRLCLVSER